MNVGDLVEYEGSHSYGKQQRDLGTIIRVDPWFREGECYVIWHTTDNEGWWSCLLYTSPSPRDRG